MAAFSSVSEAGFASLFIRRALALEGCALCSLSTETLCLLCSFSAGWWLVGVVSDAIRDAASGIVGAGLLNFSIVIEAFFSVPFLHGSGKPSCAVCFFGPNAEMLSSLLHANQRA